MTPLRAFVATHWRPLLLIALSLAALTGVMLQPPITQDATYHGFADERTFAGMNNFANVISNLPFLLVGIAGLRWYPKTERARRSMPWLVFFTGVLLVGIGSGYYHSAPDDAALVWDRLPMTVAFMGLFAALLEEYVSPRIGRYVLIPAVATGLVSIVWWRHTGDLRLYAWVQFMPLLIIPVAFLLFRPRFTHQHYLLYALGMYVLAKVAELYDRQFFAWTAQSVSGHSLKHLLAALGVFFVYRMLAQRRAR